MTWLESAANAPDGVVQFIVEAAAVERAMYAVTALGIPDLLADGPRDSESLARATGTQARLLARVLRFLVGAGLLDEPQPGRFELTPSGASLRADAPGSLRPLVLLRGAAWHRQGWNELLDTLRDGGVPFERATGAPFFDYLAEHPEAAAVFDSAMSGLTRRTRGIVSRHYDIATDAKIVDIGGGEGELLIEVLERYPEAGGVLFERPQVTADARARINQAGLADRCEVVGGDFFAAVPSGGDVYLLKMILHDWPDERAAAILTVCRRAMHATSRLVVIDRVMPTAPPYPMDTLTLDLLMLLQHGSQERNEQEWRDLFAAAGFELTRIIATGAPLSIIEGRPM